jgi:hypothetical protein
MKVYSCQELVVSVHHIQPMVADEAASEFILLIGVVEDDVENLPRDKDDN